MSTGKKLLFSTILFAIVFSFTELVAYTAARMLDGKPLFYRALVPPHLEDYYAKRDPLLGWPAPKDFGGRRYDESGSRPIPAFPHPGNACVSIYGDSFTYGSGVPDEAAWSNQLSKLLGCRVANYGVGGYGTDQAELRFEQNVDDEAPVVVLSHVSENIIRNLTRFRRLISAGDPYTLKPRFVLDEKGALKLLPIYPVSTPEEFASLVRSPEDYLEDDYFIPGGRAGIQHLSFPYTLSFIRALRHYHVRAKLAGLPGYTEFYEPDHPARGVELTSRILERFAQTARERDKLPVLQILPTGLDMLEYQETRRLIYAPLLERAKELGIDVVDLGSDLIRVVGDGDPCALFLSCNDHFNALGNEMIARRLVGALDDRHIREIAASQGRWPYAINPVEPLPAVAAAPPQ